MIAIVFLIIKLIFVKLILRKKKKEDTTTIQTKQDIIKDSFLIFVLSFAVLHGKNYFIDNSTKSSKTNVFVNEPNF